VTGNDKSGRSNQKTRTRKDLLQAAAQLVKQGQSPTLEDVAEAALVSRATAYRYFPSIDALLVEAAVDVAVPGPSEVFKGELSRDPVERLLRAEAALTDMIVSNEVLLRTMLAHTLQHGAKTGDDSKLPKRQNRRTPLIDAALEPEHHQFKPAALRELKRAMALFLGPEAFIVARDVLQIDDEEARRMKIWAIRALVTAARKTPERP
jgi:AcrR family transcriptional regulator